MLLRHDVVRGRTGADQSTIASTINSMDALLRHKYKFALVALLGGASIVAILLLWGRVAYSKANDYPSLVRNLSLAWIPFLVALAAYVISWSRPLLYLVVPVFVLVWLIFFPNAPYMLTEFHHLRVDTAAAPLWLDVLLLIWFAWTGLFLGVASLYLVQEIVARAFGEIAGWFFALVVIALGSVGIYLGRFLRWNSWDILQEPVPIARDVWGWFRHPTSNLRAYGFTALFTILFLFVYLAFHAFGHIMAERRLK